MTQICLVLKTKTLKKYNFYYIKNFKKQVMHRLALLISMVTKEKTSYPETNLKIKAICHRLFMAIISHSLLT